MSDDKQKDGLNISDLSAALPANVPGLMFLPVLVLLVCLIVLGSDLAGAFQVSVRRIGLTS